MADLLLIKGDNARLLWANKAFCTYYGMSNEALQGILDAQHSDPDDTLQYVQDDKFVFENQQVLDIASEPITDHKGTVRFFNTIKNPVLDENGRTLCTVGISRRIKNSAVTEKLKNARLETKTEIERLHSFLRSLPIPVAMIDLRMNYIAASKGWGEVILKGASMTKGSSMFHSFPHMEAQWREIFGRCLNGEHYVETEARLVMPDGSTEVVNFQVDPWFHEPYRVAGLILSVEVVTNRVAQRSELAQARDTAEAASRSKSQFLANMSHEIRTPLHGVIGMAELLRETSLNEDQHELLSTVKLSAEVLLRLINDILDFSKIEANKLEIHKSFFSLEDFINEVSRLHSSRFKEAGIEYIIKKNDPLPLSFENDVSRIHQVLGNILGNAVKFTPKGGSVMLEISVVPIKGSDEIFLKFAIRDNGIGIPLAQQNKIFDSFTQADPTITRQYGGSGLGLAIASRLVELMGGEIRLESEVGKGSTFECTVRGRARSELQSKVVSTEDSDKPGIVTALRPLRILVAEDNQVNQRLIRRILEKSGHSVVLVDDGAKAYQAFIEEEFDIVLMDIQMPMVSGDTATAKIRQFEMQSDDPPTPIIALTAFALQSDRERFVRSGFDAYLTKPLNVAELWSTIRRLVPANAFNGAALEKPKDKKVNF